MEKLKSSLTNMVAVLTVIAVIAGAVLASVNAVTKPTIEQIKEENLANGIKDVLQAPDANVTSKDTIRDEKGKVSAIVYTTDKGVAVQSTDPNGFGGALTVLVGFDSQDNIMGYKVLEHAETPGLGAKAGEWFQKGSKGSIIGLNPGQGDLIVSKDGGQVDAITASTITSRSFLRAINAAYKAKSGNTDANSGATSQAKAQPVGDCCKQNAEDCCGKCSESEGECCKNAEGDCCNKAEADCCKKAEGECGKCPKEAETPECCKNK